ncbi:hypothetical protein LSCM1_01187 [Leishmania martiniquensis]|uniref:Uncharacterized protein n=1 Tax=Leishmania martiniquensis TaxID=1580590 RepID=A0A836GZ81_9TRYP|nr:hypothetical protein LSCM1_01187 [Leishmania martiniquensis]
MLDFPEWVAGEIVEEDVGEYLDARSAHAAKMPKKMRPQGRIPPKKDTKLSASPKALVGFVPLVDCEIVDDDLAGKGLAVSPSSPSLDSRQLSKAPPLRHPPPQPKVPLAPTKESGAASTPSAAALSTARPRPCSSSTAGASVDHRGSKAPSASQSPTSTATAPSGTGRPSATLQNSDSRRRPSPTSRSRSSEQSGSAVTPPPTGCQKTDPTSTPNKGASRVFSSRVSVSSGEGGAASECENSVGITAAPLSAPPGMSLPALQSETVRARNNTVRKSFSAETPAPLQVKIPSQAPLSAGASGSSSVPVDRAVSSGNVALASFTRVMNRRSSFRGTVSSTYAARGSRAAADVAAPAPSDPLKSVRSETNALRPSHSPQTVPSASEQRARLHAKGDPGPSCDDYSYGGFFMMGGAPGYQPKDSLAGAQSCAAASSGASSTDYSVLRAAYDAYAHGLRKTGSSTVLPHIGPSLAYTTKEVRDFIACPSSLPAVSGQGSDAMPTAAQQHSRPPRYSVPTGVLAALTQSFSSKRTVNKSETTRTKAPSAAPARAVGDKEEEVNEEGEEKDPRESSNSPSSDMHRTPGSNKNRLLRRRGMDFDEV